MNRFVWAALMYSVVGCSGSGETELSGKQENSEILNTLHYDLKQRGIEFRPGDDTLYKDLDTENLKDQVAAFYANDREAIKKLVALKENMSKKGYVKKLDECTDLKYSQNLVVDVNSFSMVNKNINDDSNFVRNVNRDLPSGCSGIDEKEIKETITIVISDHSHGRKPLDVLNRKIALAKALSESDKYAESLREDSYHFIKQLSYFGIDASFHKDTFTISREKFDAMLTQIKQTNWFEMCSNFIDKYGKHDKDCHFVFGVADAPVFMPFSSGVQLPLSDDPDATLLLLEKGKINFPSPE